jgi:hypothetical protein
MWKTRSQQANLPKLDSHDFCLFMPWLLVQKDIVTLVCHANWMVCPVVGIFRSTTVPHTRYVQNSVVTCANNKDNDVHWLCSEVYLEEAL